MPDSGKSKRTASVSVRVSSGLKSRLEDECKRVGSPTMSALMVALVEEALSAREAPGGKTLPLDPAVLLKLEAILQAVSEAKNSVQEQATTADYLEQVEARQLRTAELLGEELTKLRKDMRAAVANFVRLAYPKLEDDKITKLVNDAFDT